MFVVYGSKEFKKDLGNTRIVYHCNHCNNDNSQILSRNRKFFTLYWIPIIPYSTKYFVRCPICNMGYEISKSDVMAGLQGPTADGNYING